MAVQEVELPAGVGIDRLTRIVKEVLGTKKIGIPNYEWRDISGSQAQTYLVEGTAHENGNLIPWDVVLKIWSPNARNLGFWYREPRAYQSGLLDDLPGGIMIMAPICFEVEEVDGVEFRLWLEAIKDEITTREDPYWPVEHYRTVARHFGQLNGAFVGQEVRLRQEYPWLSVSFLGDLIKESAPDTQTLREILSLPLLQAYVSPQLTDEFCLISEEREIFLSALSLLPRSLCHLDADRRNLFARQDAHGDWQTVAIDWAFMGIAPLGAELAPLMLVDASRLKVRTSLEDFDGVVFNGYLQGLHDMGWEGDPRLIRLGATATAVLRFGLGNIGIVRGIAESESTRSHIEEDWGHAIEVLLPQFVEVGEYIVKLSKETRKLLSELEI